MERQTILERLGWRFIRIRGSEYYRDAEKTMARVIRELKEYGIEPEESLVAPTEGRETGLLKRIKREAAQILEGNSVEAFDATVTAALDPMKMIRELSKESAKLHKSATNRAIPSTRPDMPEQIGKTFQREEASTSASNEVAAQERTKRGEVFVSARVKSKKPLRQPFRAVKKQEVKDEPGQMVLPGMEPRRTDEADVIDLLKKHNISYIDKRAKGGALWVIGGSELRLIMNECSALGMRFTYHPEGGRATRGRPGWYGKSIQGKETVAMDSKTAKASQTLWKDSETMEQELISEIRFLLDMFQTGVRSQSAIPGDPLTISGQLDAACEAAGTMTDKELEACLLTDMTELPTGVGVLDHLRNDPQVV